MLFRQRLSVYLNTAFYGIIYHSIITSEVENVPLSHTLQIILQFLVY